MGKWLHPWFMWNIITYPYPYFNGGLIEVSWMCHYIPLIYVDATVNYLYMP